MEDERCCGTGTCLINAEGVCWCGQKWDGETMCTPQWDVKYIPNIFFSQSYTKFLVKLL